MAFSGISASAELATYFALQKGFNATSALTEISVGRLFLDGNLFTASTDITVTSSEGSYTLSTSTGYFPVYRFYSDPETVIQISIDADSGAYSGAITVTPTTAGYIDINIELVAGMAIKSTAVVVVPPVPDSLLASDTPSLSLCSCVCPVVEKAFTDEIGADAYKNDKSSFLFRKFAVSDIVSIELWKAGVKVTDITDSSYGDFYDFGDFTSQPDYKAIVLDWFKVWQSFGYGKYQLKAIQVLNGVSTGYESRYFQLMQFDEFAANGTVKIETWQQGKVLSSAFDYTDLIDGGWYQSIRITGFFGNKTPVLEVDNYITTAYEKQQIQDKIRNEYTLESKLLDADVADSINQDAILANRIAISDYNANNRKLKRIEVVPVSIEARFYAQNPKASYIVKFEERNQSTIKRNF